MEPISTAVREAALQALAALNPPAPPLGAAAAGQGGHGHLFGAPSHPSEAASIAFADALAAAFCAGLGPAWPQQLPQLQQDVYKAHPPPQ